MSEIAHKLGAVAAEIRAEKGSVDLFALLLPETSDDWDLAFSASWANADKMQSLLYLNGKLDRILTKQEKLRLSRIVILEHGTANLAGMLGGPVKESSIVEAGSFVYNDVWVDKAFFIVLNPPPIRKSRSRGRAS